jgi:hypothetical protein
LHGEEKAKEMRTDERRQQRLDKKKRDAEVKKHGAGIGAEGGGVNMITAAAVRVCVRVRACII